MMALPMRWLARIAAALVWLLDSTSGLFFRLLGMSRDATAHVTAEELHLIVAEASRSGVLEEYERSIRSEEHTSELQSLMRISYAVFCLKKTTKTKTTQHIHNSHTQH